MNARQAAALIKKELEARQIPFTKVSAKTVGFQDLARCDKIFVRIEGWRPSPVAGELREIGWRNGFVVEFVTLQGVQA